EPVSRILGSVLRIIGSTELVHRTQQDRPLKCLHGHSIVDEVFSQILQQFRVRWTLAGRSEIAGSIHNARPEMGLPDSIDKYPHRKRLFDDRVSEFQAAASIGVGHGITLRKKTQEVTWYRWTCRIVGISAECHLNVF